MTNKPVVTNRKDVSIEDFPPKVRKVAKYIETNIKNYSISKVCQSIGVDYKNVMTMISRSRKKGNDFNVLLESMRASRNSGRVIFVDDAVYKKALGSDTAAAKLFYQSNGYIQTGSGGDRLTVNNIIQLGTVVPLIAENGNILPNNLKDVYDVEKDE